VTFQPEPLPVASATPKAVIVLFVVCAWPLSEMEFNVGRAGTMENDSEPGVTANWVWSSWVAPNATPDPNAKIKSASANVKASPQCGDADLGRVVV
jgi:hypothetical protein